MNNSNVSSSVSQPWDNILAVSIVQQASNLECLIPCFCEQPNRYTLTSTDETGVIQKQEIGTFIEISDLSSRILCQCYRPWRINFFSSSQIQYIPITHAQRIYGLPRGLCCPFMRGTVIIEKENIYIGKITQPYRPLNCSYEQLNIYDYNDNQLYTITSLCCQSGVIARSLCLCRCQGKCRQIHFEILNNNQEIVGSIKNLYGGCQQELFTKADNFVLVFPTTASYDDKLLLVHAVLFIDYDLFETTCLNMP